MNYYISDLHLGHGNVLRFDGRPFESVEQMCETIISNWNKTIHESDIVYILGDFSWYGAEKTAELLDRLNGAKVLIKGNHDRVSPQVAKRYASVHEYLEVNDNGTRVVLCHYPIFFWNKRMNGSVHLYGHIHNSVEWEMCKAAVRGIELGFNEQMRMYNVGCMMPWMNYTPRTLQEIISNYGGTT